MRWETFAHDADVGVRGFGATLGEAFAAAATALTAVITDPHRVTPRESVAISCAAPDYELLLVDWLNALIYEMATRHMLFSHFEVEIADLQLMAQAFGEPIDVERHQPAAEIKGASFCALEVSRHGDEWLAQCVVDV
ncbi:MAG: archease [Rhodocyclaceae bacterium]|nr:archease [Rhodocyclaceae bacterium]